MTKFPSKTQSHERKLIISFIKNFTIQKMDVFLYRFPQSLDGFQKITNVEQLRKKIKIGLSELLGIHYQAGHDDRMIAYCLKNECGWRLSYRKKFAKVGEYYEAVRQEKYTLIKFNLLHNHPIQKTLDKKIRPKLKTLFNQQRLICQALHDAHIDPKFITNYIGAIAGVAPLPHRFSFYNFFQNKKVKDNYTFYQWFKVAKNAKIDIITYPPYSDTLQNVKKYIEPDFIILTSQKIKKVYRSKGQVIGVKIIKNKITDTNKHYKDYDIAVFYEFLPNNAQMMYLVAVFPQGSKLLKKSKQKCQQMSDVQFKGYGQQDSMINSRFPQKMADEKATNRRQNYLRININLYKVMRLFLQVMGNKVKTFVVQDKQEQIHTMQYLLQVLNNPKTPENAYPHKINYVINPLEFIQRYIPESLKPIARKLTAVHSYEEYYRIYKEENLKLRNSDEIKALRKLHQNRHRFLVFQRDEKIFLGGWLDWNKQFYSVYLDSNQKKARPLTYMLLSICIGMKKQIERSKNMGSGSARFKNVIQFTRVAAYYDYDFIETYRCSLYQSAFKSLMTQINNSYNLSFIFGSNRKVMFDNKNFTTVNEIYNQKQNQIKAKVDKQDQQQKDYISDFFDSENYKQITPFIKKQNIKSINFDEWRDQMQSERRSNYKEQFENYQSKAQQIQDQDEQFVGQPFQTYYGKVINQIGKAEPLMKQNQQIQDSDINTDSVLSVKRQMKFDYLQSRIPALNIRYATYQQIYPLRPATEIKHFNVVPPFFQFWDEGKIFYCKQQRINQNQNQNIINVENPKRKQPLYVCSCNYTNIRGLPCRHILKICLKFKLDIDPYIHDYWRTVQNYNQWRQFKYLSRGLQVPRLGRPKSSRRNKITRN